MSSDTSFDELIVRLRQRDQQAAEAVFQRFSNRLIALAQSRLAAKLRQKVGPDDVMQSVFRSFFRRHADGQYTLDSWDSLWSLLVVMTLHKCGHQADRYLAARRSVDRELPAARDDELPNWEAIAREPTPSEVVMLNETIEQVMRSLNPLEQQMLALKLQGYRVSEISSTVGRSERTVERLFDRLRARLSNVRETDIA